MPSEPRNRVDQETAQRRRAQLERQLKNLVACEYHTDVRYMESRPGGCPKCEHLFKQGRAPNGTMLPGHSANPAGGNQQGYTQLRSLMKRYAKGTDAQSRSYQERIARLIVERAAQGIEPYLGIYLARFDPVVNSSRLEVDDKRPPAEPPVIPNDDERDRQVALILAELQREGGDAKTPDDFLSRLVEGTDTKQ